LTGEERILLRVVPVPAVFYIVTVPRILFRSSSTPSMNEVRPFAFDQSADRRFVRIVEHLADLAVKQSPAACDNRAEARRHAQT
jgi:hypothetical protein